MSKVFIVYDTQYGNTQEIAEIMHAEIMKQHDSQVLQVRDALETDLREADLIIIGSPTHGGRPTAIIKNFLGLIEGSSKIAVFDTSTTPDGEKGFTQFIIKFFGNAAPRMAAILRKRGIQTVGTNKTFLVRGSEGPIVERENDKAKEWIQTLLR